MNKARRGCMCITAFAVSGWSLLACQVSSSNQVQSPAERDSGANDASALDANLGDASTLDATVRDAGATTGCLDHTIHWGSNGGLVASSTEFTLEPCRNYGVSLPQASNAPMALCATEVPLDAKITADDIDALIEDADVSAALAAAPIVYGVDSRPVDGTVQRIEIDGAIIDIGGPCSGTASCVEIPAGVAALQDTLDSLMLQQRSVVPNCLGTN